MLSAVADGIVASIVGESLAIGVFFA